ncbi:hypothetical protein E0H71_26970 [Rhizobium leguminosarum bv. viciae]|nr:thiamine pyrophosphate-binding protein [Rhizobium leguminosarum]MBY5330070.1 hypothetical protein [Rhizobium leguminosarum]MBY5475563.1 hypothetical protein [Rhizobium leguminosarum]MBY5494608.1 hypothetical protein [Rhizobium leguminosarum]TCA29566.1 hypothetical protein E0H72_36020 [Rhizobium leguminosarum bv. viciae]TCA49220.1 hypothetical protein E0H71_26970 [Rhizobium leguminosarum bv. viciae]
MPKRREKNTPSQKAVTSNRQGLSQKVDVVASMKPLKRQIVSPQMRPTMVSEAFRIAPEDKAAPVLLELPGDIAAEECQEIEMVQSRRNQHG